MIDVEALADTVLRKVRVRIGENVGSIGLRGIHLDRYVIAATHEIVLRDGARQDDLVRTGRTQTQHQVTRRLLGNIHIHIELIGRPADCRCLDGNLGEEPELVDPLFGSSDLVGIVPAAFHLANFTPDDLVARLGGDEFIVFMTNTELASAVEAKGAEILDILAKSETTPHFTVSIGAAAYPAAGNDYESLYLAADNAMYASKKSGKNRIHVDNGQQKKE